MRTFVILYITTVVLIYVSSNVHWQKSWENFKKNTQFSPIFSKWRIILMISHDFLTIYVSVGAIQFQQEHFWAICPFLYPLQAISSSLPGMHCQQSHNSMQYFVWKYSGVPNERPCLIRDDVRTFIKQSVRDGVCNERQCPHINVHVTRIRH